jgi:hypothetical protein
MSKDGLQFRSATTDAVVHAISTLDLITKYSRTLQPLVKLAIKEGIFSDKDSNDLGNACSVFAEMKLNE